MRERGADPLEELPLGPVRLGRFIERTRLHRGMSQGELARAAAMKNPSYLSAIEAGQRKWPDTVIPALARALRVHQAEFAYHAGVITEPLEQRSSVAGFAKGDPRHDLVDVVRVLSDEDVGIVLNNALFLRARRDSLHAPPNTDATDEEPLQASGR